MVYVSWADALAVLPLAVEADRDWTVTAAVGGGVGEGGARGTSMGGFNPWGNEDPTRACAILTITERGRRAWGVTLRRGQPLQGVWTWRGMCWRDAQFADGRILMTLRNGGEDLDVSSFPHAALVGRFDYSGRGVRARRAAGSIRLFHGNYFVSGFRGHCSFPRDL